MIQKLKLALFALMLSLTSLAPAALVPATAHAADNIQGALCNGAQSASGDSTTANCQEADLGSGNKINSVARKIVNLVSIIVGAISIIMIIYGGFRYITSGGDSGRVGTAKNTLIYAVIGLIVVALAQLIVNVVLSTASNVTS